LEDDPFLLGWLIFRVELLNFQGVVVQNGDESHGRIRKKIIQKLKSKYLNETNTFDTHHVAILGQNNSNTPRLLEPTFFLGG